jgi:hypothetical protein
VGSIVDSIQVLENADAARAAAAGFTDRKVLRLRNVLRAKTAGFAAARNNGRDINSNDSLINYLHRPNGLLSGPAATTFRQAARP